MFSLVVEQTLQRAFIGLSDATWLWSMGERDLMRFTAICLQCAAQLKVVTAEGTRGRGVEEAVYETYMRSLPCMPTWPNVKK